MRPRGTRRVGLLHETELDATVADGYRHAGTLCQNPGAAAQARRVRIPAAFFVPLCVGGLVHTLILACVCGLVHARILEWGCGGIPALLLGPSAVLPWSGRSDSLQHRCSAALVRATGRSHFHAPQTTAWAPRCCVPVRSRPVLCTRRIAAAFSILRRV